jgi:hypothetical protein
MYPRLSQPLGRAKARLVCLPKRRRMCRPWCLQASHRRWCLRQHLPIHLRLHQPGCHHFLTILRLHPITRPKHRRKRRRADRLHRFQLLHRQQSRPLARPLHGQRLHQRQLPRVPPQKGRRSCLRLTRRCSRAIPPRWLPPNSLPLILRSRPLTGRLKHLRRGPQPSQLTHPVPLQRPCRQGLRQKHRPSALPGRPR